MDDTISRQAAIETAVSYIEEWNGAQSKFHRNRITERFLNLPSAQPERIKISVDHEMTEEELKELTKKIADLPVVLLPFAQRKKGRWIDDGKGFYMCSSCGKLWVHWWAKCVPLNQMCKELRYCPMCGADMRGESDG